MCSHVRQVWLVLNFPVPDLPVMAFNFGRRTDGERQSKRGNDGRGGSLKLRTYKFQCNWRTCCWGCPGRVCFCIDDRFLTRNIAAVMRNKEDSVENYELERLSVSKAIAKPPSKVMKDEKFHFILPEKTAPKWSVSKSESKKVESRPDELSYMSITGHDNRQFQGSSVKKSPKGVIRLYGKPAPEDGLFNILKDVNTVMQNHIDRLITGTTTEEHKKCEETSAWNWESCSPQVICSNNYKESGGQKGGLSVERGMQGPSFEHVSPKPDIKIPVHLSENGRQKLTTTEIQELSTMDTLAMLDRLPSLSEVVKEELDVDDDLYQNHFDVLLQQQQVQTEKWIQLNPEDRWFTLLYTDNSRKGDDDNHLHLFQSLIIRLILLAYCVVFEERDVSHTAILQELVHRFHGKEVELRLPFVFTLEMFVGSHDVLYGLHNRRLMPLIFKRTMVSRPVYMEWRRHSDTDDVSKSFILQVHSDRYPRVENFLHDDFGGRRSALKSRSQRQFVECVKTIKQCLDFWDARLSKKYWDPDLRLYVLLKCTISDTLLRMEKILNSSKASTSSKKSGSIVSTPRSSPISSENAETSETDEQDLEKRASATRTSLGAQQARSDGSSRSSGVPRDVSWQDE